MTPTLRPGSDVIVFRTHTLVRPGRLVVYRDRFDDGLRVKRAVGIDAAAGTVTVSGDNVVLSTPPAELGRVPMGRVEGVVVLARDPRGRYRRPRYAGPP